MKNLIKQNTGIMSLTKKNNNLQTNEVFNNINRLILNNIQILSLKVIEILYKYQCEILKIMCGRE